MAAMAATIALAVAACGGDSSPNSTTTGGANPQQPDFTDDRPGLVKPEPAQDRANRVPRSPSVTYNDPPPPIAAEVKAAAEAAGCAAASFASEADPQSHLSGEAATTFSIPPLSGAHNERWADWGVYNKPVPYKHQLHNLEHGGVIIHYGTEVPVEGVNALREMWARSPAYLMIVPNTSPQFPKDAVVAGSWQRWVVCKPFAPAQVSAMERFAAAYRGRGPESAAALNGSRPEGVAGPEISDKGAEG